LTLGLVGLEELHLRALATSSEDPNEQRNAQKVLHLMSKGRHWVLVVRSFHVSCSVLMMMIQ
jgi:metal transporter CNNM